MKNKDLPAAVLSYLTPIGWLLAMLLNHESKSEYVKFHMRQSLGIYILYFALFLAAMLTMRLPIVGYAGLLLISVINFCVIVYLIMGIYYAAKGKKQLLPLMGQWAQDKLRIIIP